MRWPARVALGLLAFASLAVPILAPLAREAARRPVQVSTARLMRLTPSVLASGVLVHARQATLAPQVMGRVAAIRVTEGQRVRAGEPVLELDHRDARAAVAQFTAAQEQARIDVRRDQAEVDYRAARAERVRTLRDQGLVTTAQHDEFAHAEEGARLQLRASQVALVRAAAQLAQANEALAKTEILAPIDGQVGSVEVRVGETVVPGINGVPGSVLLTVVDPSDLRAEVDIDEADVARVGPGQAARLTVAAEADKAYPATVLRVALLPTQRPHGRVYRTQLRLADSAGSAFRAGMGCRAEIDVGQPAKGVAVPHPALLEPGDAPGVDSLSVFVVTDGVARLRAVAKGQSDDEHVEIVSGLAAGEVVAVGPPRTLHDLRDGQRVRASGPEADSPPAR